MNPLISEWIASMVRKALTFVAGYAAAYGFISHDLSGRMIEAAIPLSISIVWTLWVKYKDRLKLVTALSSPPMSEDKVKALIADPNVENPPVTTPASVTPRASSTGM